MSEVSLTAEEFTRLANNFYVSNGLDDQAYRINIDSGLMNYINTNAHIAKQKQKIAFVWICLNPPYWEFAKNMIEGARRFFLPGHEVDYFLWSDIPLQSQDVLEKRILVELTKGNPDMKLAEACKQAQELAQSLYQIKKGATVFETETVEWPMPTLMRYHLFLQQEEILSKYDYIFYCDVDMHFVSVVGDEILGKGLTAALHPGYAVDKKFWPPYEPNEKSTSYIPRPGLVINDPTSQSQQKKRFMPLYYAGGFQGGKAEKFIEAMKVMRQKINSDFSQNYVAIWNDETHWNRYLFDNPPSIVLSPSYIFPDSLLEEYYYPLWGVRHVPKLVTLTKKFSITPQGGEAARQMAEQLKAIKK